MAQTVVGGRTTLLVGLITGLGVVSLGALVGGTAGYFGGRVDDALTLLINVFLVLPGLPLMVVLAAVYLGWRLIQGIVWVAERIG